MSRRFATNIDLTGFSLIGALMNPVSSDLTGLGTGDAGRVWFNTTSGLFKYWNGTAAIDPLARANHSGTQLASTISDLASTVKGYSLDQFAAAAADVSLGTHKLTNVVDPVGAQDAATRNYVDTALASLASGQVLKGAVACAPTTNVSLSAPGATLDGVTMTSGMIVLLTGQTTASQNGPYVWTGPSTTLTRATNFASSAQAAIGSYWVVEQGANADTFCLLTNDSAITLGTTSLTFSFRGASGATLTGSATISISAGVVSAILASGGGLVGTSGLAVDTSVVGRKVGGVIPATTTGIYSVSGLVVTINHGLGNSAPLFVLRAYTSPASGYSAGQQVEVDNVASDANNLVVTLPALASNNWVCEVIG